MALSGGQKARVSLARCVYRKCQVYLLDDPLSSVDAGYSKVLLESCVRRLLCHAAVLLVTHQVQQLTEANKICLMEAGKVIKIVFYESIDRVTTPPKSLFTSNYSFHQPFFIGYLPKYLGNHTTPNELDNH